MSLKHKDKKVLMLKIVNCRKEDDTFYTFVADFFESINYYNSR